MLTFLIEEYRFNKNTLSKYLEITEETIDGVVMGNVECLLDDPALRLKILSKAGFLYFGAIEDKDKMCIRDSKYPNGSATPIIPIYSKTAISLLTIPASYRQTYTQSITTIVTKFRQLISIGYTELPISSHIISRRTENSMEVFLFPMNSSKYLR